MFTYSEEHKVRFQGAFDKDEANSYYRLLWAVRIVSGHKPFSIHDPTRFAASAPGLLKGAVSGIFHITDSVNVPSILKKGLVPGGNREGRKIRADVHFTAFTIFETDDCWNRGSVLSKRLEIAQANNLQLAMIAVDVDRAWSMLRICVANGYFLCNQIVTPKMFDSIIVARWDPKTKAWILEFLLDRSLESTVVHGYKGQNWSRAHRRSPDIGRVA
jgi:hypothetical protein